MEVAQLGTDEGRGEGGIRIKQLDRSLQKLHVVIFCSVHGGGYGGDDGDEGNGRCLKVGDGLLPELGRPNLE